MFRLSRRTIILGILSAALLCGGVGYRVYTSRASYLLRQGQRALASDRWDEAETLAADLEAHGYLRHAHLLRGEAWVRKGRFLPTETGPAGAPGRAAVQRRPQALAAMRRALAELEPVRDDGTLGTDAAVLAAECLIRLGEGRRAVPLLTAVVERRPDHMEAHRWLAAVYMDMNSPEEAVAEFREWGRLDPQDGRPYRWVGFLHRA
jgi:tetratricopeptide (TPR) repeat protein